MALESGVALDPRRFVSISTRRDEGQPDLFSPTQVLKVYQGRKLAAEFENNEPLDAKDIEWLRTARHA